MFRVGDIVAGMLPDGRITCCRGIVVPREGTTDLGYEYLGCEEHPRTVGDLYSGRIYELESTPDVFEFVVIEDTFSRWVKDCRDEPAS